LKDGLPLAAIFLEDFRLAITLVGLSGFTYIGFSGIFSSLAGLSQQLS
jgi:hypothetical protein